MQGKKYLAKNISFLTLSQLGTKLLSFFLVPLYTYTLSTAEYGIYDFYTTTVLLLVPILTFNIADAVFRFSLDKERKNEEILLVSVKYYIISICLAGAITIINDYCDIVSILSQNSLFFFLMFSSNALNGILINYARGINKVKETAISGVICTFVIIALNIVFLLYVKIGLTGYFLATIIGGTIQNIYLLACTRVLNNLKRAYRNTKLEKEMIIYGRPLLVNGISWWISSSSDRYIVTWLRGIAENGIYSVGYKIPSILNIFQSIFNQAWTISAVKEFDPEDKSGFFRDMYNSYNFCMVFVCSVLIALTKIMAKFLYKKDFFIAWQYVPFLLIAIVFGALAGYIGGIYAAVKDTKMFAKTSIIGAITNIILNVLLVYTIGAVGAAIATMISYIIVWIIRILSVKKYITLRINLKRDILAYLILLLQTIIFFIVKSEYLLYCIEILLLLSELVLYRNEIINVKCEVMKYVRKK